jgi:hypothetical protein
MNIKPLSRHDSAELWKTWIAGQTVSEDQELCPDEKKFRMRFITHVEEAAEENIKIEDKEIGIALLLYYELLPLKGGKFSLRMASDDAIWRSLTMRIIPDYVQKRWGIRHNKGNGEFIDQKAHFWSQPQRNWLKALWWYCHFADRGDLNIDYARGLLLSISSHADPIQGLVERPGRRGYDVELNRELLARLAGNAMGIDKFRELLKLNTAASRLTEPSLYSDGIKGYVDLLAMSLPA